MLETSEAFVAREGGFALASSGDLSRDIDIAAPLQRRGGLRAALPARGEGEIRFQLPGGFEARVRELDAEGEGVIVERAVAYPRKGGTSFWAAIDDGYEEWLLLDAGVASADAPAAAWEVEGATLRQQGDAVEVVDETGTARLRVTAPAAFARGGRPIAAWLTVRGATLELWADAGGEPALVDPVWAPAGTMSTAHWSHTATLLQDGKVLIVAGGAFSLLADAELYSPATNTWSSAGSLATARRAHTAVRLSDGKVLVAGGTNLTNSARFASAELYDPATNSWSSAASMTTQRWGHTATLLQDGRVLVTGGHNGSATLTSAELYDPTTDSWSSAASLGASRFGHSATLLQDGRVLVTGGRNTSYLASAELYDPSTNSWSSVGTMGTARSSHTETLLQDGRVLVTGGYNSVSLELSSAEIFDPSSLAWTAASSMSVSRLAHAATLLQDGKVLVTGGTVSQSSPISTATVEVYDPVTNAWTGLQSMSDERTLHTATLLANGRVLVTGGRWYSPSGTVDLASAEVYDPAATLWVSTPSMPNAHGWFSATLLHDGRVLAAGTDDAWNHTADLYDPATNTWAAAASMAGSHEWSTMTRLGNNKVLVAGDYSTTLAVTSAELYDPATDTWSSVGSSTISRHEHTATLLTDGTVLLIGGRQAGVTHITLATTTLYDPVSNTWTAKASMGAARFGHTATLLGNGMVLVTGGVSSTTEVATAELYDPATNTWTPAASMSNARRFHTATLLSNGNVLIAGGDNNIINYLASTEIYDPSSNTWTSGPSLSGGRSLHTATRLNDDRVLVAAGWTSSPPNGVVSIASAEIYDPVSNAWTTVNSLNDARTAHAAVLLGDGRVLALGGSANGTWLSSAEIYSP